VSPIAPSDLRALLRGDAVSLALWGLLAISGILALAVAIMFRRHAMPLLWMAVFAHLYGLRLLIRTETFRLYAGASMAGWDYVEAAITYLVPIPIVLFARAMFPASKRFWTWGAAGLTAFAAGAVAADAILSQPGSAMAPNNLIAIAFFTGLLVWVFRPAPAPSRELTLVRIGALAVSLSAVADNLRGMKLVLFRGPDIEPFGFTAFVACLGVVAGRRVFADVNRVIAINRELDIARRIQSSILPQAMPRVPGLVVASRYRPMTAVAGDFYDFLELDRARLGILVADVTGHGVPAALIASMVKVALAAQRDHADRPGMVLAGMNDVLCGRLAGQFVTAAYLFIDGDARLMRYGAAGHPPMLRSSRSTDRVDQLEQNGIMLGFLEGQEYAELEAPLQSDDRFVLYTDGLIEAPGADDDLYGMERVAATVRDGATLDAEPFADRVLTAVEQWSGRALGDDVTLVVVDWSVRRRDGNRHQ
jgi:sigma-B regulation protein RsbU (phosphoserine phosphatase)